MFFKNQLQGLRSWMNEMEVFLHEEDPLVVDISTLEAQLHESNVSLLYIIYSAL